MSEIEDLDPIKTYLATPRESRHDQMNRAFECFFEIHRPLILDLAKNCADRRGDVDDLVQDMWIVLSEKLGELTYNPDRGSLRAWITVVARRAALRGMRRIRRQRADALLSQWTDGLIDRRPDAVALCVQGEERELVMSSLTKLGTQMSKLSYRIAVLHWIDGNSLAEIAFSLNVID